MSASPDPVPGVVATIITAAAALLGAFVGSVGRPLAEDVAARWRERRVARQEREGRERARIEHIQELLRDCTAQNFHREQQAKAELTSAASAIGDPRLSEAIGQYLSGGGQSSLTDAKHRAGELLLEREREAAVGKGKPDR